MKIVTVVGARPQFIKYAAVSLRLRKVAAEVLVHTGQHYDDNMSDLFFRDLKIPKPDYNLGVGSGPHGAQTGEMLKLIEEVLLKERPDCVLVFGDTNSTLAGTLAAAKLNIPVAHVEAGVRSFNRRMPEEINRLVTDRLSTLLFCPTNAAVKNLIGEGITQGVHLVGDVMYDVLHYNIHLVEGRSTILEKLGLRPKEYFLGTVHRSENTDNLGNLRNIMSAFVSLAKGGQAFVFPVHPRTRRQLDILGMEGYSELLIIEPVSYLDMLVLEKYATVILTDSGGIQKEAYWFGVPCITLREDTEWVETVEAGRNTLVGTDSDRIVTAARLPSSSFGPHNLDEDGRATERVVEVLAGLRGSQEGFCG